ncbi:MAG TPA: methyltransferase domain-containing protein [Vicinamibacteria bacterium]
MELSSPWTSDQFWRESSARDDGGYHSFALPGLLQRLGEDRKSRILDLGPAHGATVEFFSQYSCKLYVADLYRSLMAHLAEPGGDRLPAPPEEAEDEAQAAAERARVFNELLPYDDDTRFDLILAWDLLNYLEPEQIGVLGRRLASFSYGGTRLFAMVAMHREIPARPCAFRIRDAETLDYEALTQRTRPAPRHTEPTLRRLLSGFDVASTCVLRNGLQEYVFAFR